MGNIAKRAEGAAEELGGAIEKKIGRALGSEQLEVDGRAKELEGRARQERAKTGERIKGKAEQVAGAIKHRVGAVIGDEQMEVEGKAKELKGAAREKANPPSPRRH